jgi:nitroimidazol reductase NimA-like FMN-containing flavoprotein (pyridoxamine 5'-phosphate oxidase superfamily)
MHLVDPRTGIDVLDRDACLALLAGRCIGRLGVVTHGSPRIFPVNFVLDGDAVVFRTASGTKLRDGVRSPACFEVDQFDEAQRTGWSVLLVGLLDEVTPYQHRLWERVHDLPVDPWAGGGKDHILRLVPQQVTGRRL